MYDGKEDASRRLFLVGGSVFAELDVSLLEVVSLLEGSLLPSALAFR